MIFFALLQKELLILWRRPATLVAVLGLAVTLVVITSFAFRQIGQGVEELNGLTPGIIWSIFVFTGVVSLSHSFVSEEENRALQGVMISPVSPASVFLAKSVSQMVFLTGVQTVVMVLHSLFFNPALWSASVEMFAIALVVSVGFVALGTLLAGIAVTFNGRELLLPVVLFPLVLPLITAAVLLTRDILSNGSLDFNNFWLTVLVVFDVIAVTCGVSLFEYVVRE